MIICNIVIVMYILFFYKLYLNYYSYFLFTNNTNDIFFFQVGPAGSQFGLLACLIVEVLNCWPMLKHPFQALMKLLTFTFLLFLFGLLPWVDNFAHLFGFVFGFLLSYALLPFVSFGPYDRQKKIFLIWVCLLSSLFLFILLVLLFYLIPIYDCEVCHYFNCIPLTRDFCAAQNINFKREEYVVWQWCWLRFYCKTVPSRITSISFAIVKLLVHFLSLDLSFLYYCFSLYIKLILNISVFLFKFVFLIKQKYVLITHYLSFRCCKVGFFNVKNMKSLFCILVGSMFSVTEPYNWDIIFRTLSICWITSKFLNIDQVLFICLSSM